jgi:predicted RNA-binding Zn-ribbon protein involved in translation (DUF1610 family)
MDFVFVVVAVLVGIPSVLALAWARNSLRQSDRDHTPKGGKGVTHEPQVAGFHCVSCKQRIVTADEGAPCPQCGKPSHRSCLPHSHGDEDATPYR